MRDRYNEFIDRHTLAWELVMGFLAIIYVAVGFALDDPNASSLVLGIDVVLTVVFVAEFTSRLGAARDRRAYLRGHWIDALALIPAVRGVRIARLARVLRLTRFFASSYRAVVIAERMRGAQGIALVVVGWSAVTVISCVAFYAVEVDANEGIKDFTDALWWGVSTLSTVGYGDISPATAEGRLVAGGLMFLGIGLFSAVTAIATNTMTSSSGATRPSSPIDDLERIAALHASNALTIDEFASAKTRLLAQL